MFNKILIVYNEKLSKKHLASIEKVKELLAGKEYCIAKCHELCEDDFKGIDLAITIGGDGTFIRTARFIKNELILGINSEPELSEGALTSINENEIPVLKEILQGKYKTISRERARIKRNNVLLNELALNEVYAGAANQFHTSRYIIKFKGKSEEQRSSGVLVVTGSGSNAWFKSAGGIPFRFNEKKLKFLVREPFSGDRLFKPKLLLSEISECEKIEFEGKRYYGGVIAIDANSIYDFNAGDRIEIELSDCPLKVIVKKENEK